MEKLDHFLGSRDQPSPCLNLVSPLATRRFTDNTSCSLPEQSRSYDILVTCYIRSTQRKLADNTHPYQTRAKRDDASWYWPCTKKSMNKHQNIAKEHSLNLSHLTSWSTSECSVWRRGAKRKCQGLKSCVCGGVGWGCPTYIAVPRCEIPLKTYVNNARLLVDMSHMRISNPLGWPHTQTQTMYTQTRYKHHLISKFLSPFYTSGHECNDNSAACWSQSAENSPCRQAST